MATFTLSIVCENDAFQPVREPELARLLEDIADKISDGKVTINHPFPIHDANGNNVGIYMLTAPAPWGKVPR